jgi:hypothetical protein
MAAPFQSPPHRLSISFRLRASCRSHAVSASGPAIAHLLTTQPVCVVVVALLSFVLQITVLCQQVVLQELPVPRVTLPRNDWKPLDAAAAATSSMLNKQRRVQLLLPQTQLTRLGGLLAQVMQPPAAPAAPAAAEGAEPQAPKGRGKGGRGQQERRRECNRCACEVASASMRVHAACSSQCICIKCFGSGSFYVAFSLPRILSGAACWQTINSLVTTQTQPCKRCRFLTCVSLSCIAGCVLRLQACCWFGPQAQQTSCWRALSSSTSLQQQQ